MSMSRRSFRRLTLDLCVTLVFLALLASVVAKLRQDEGAETLTGHARIIDGDTLAIGKARLRLLGIDAPERAQTCGDSPGWPCGTQARARLTTLIGRDAVVCRAEGRDRYRRWLAECRVEGRNLNAAMVREGLAVASGAYLEEERAARTEKRGLWSGPFERPRDWRASHGEMAEPSHMSLTSIDDLLDRIRRWWAGEEQ